MSIKFEGKPPFYLGIAEVASAHALDGSVVLRTTISLPEMRPKSVPVQFIVATDVAKALAEQLPIAGFESAYCDFYQRKSPAQLIGRFLR